MKSRFIQRSVFGFLAATFLLVGCTGELKHSLSEGQADEILVALKERGIDAQKKSVEVNHAVSYNITTSRTRLDDARRILVVLGLPREKMIGIEEICGGNDALIPSPSIDRCKMQLALQNEIVRGLMSIEGVVEAKVNINIPDQNVLSDQPAPRPTAAVVVKYIPEESGKVPFDEKKLREYVANSVDNLDYNDVALMSTPARAIKAALDALDGRKPKEPAEVKETKTAKAEKPEEIEQASQENQTAFMGIESNHPAAKNLKVVALVATVAFMVLGAGMIVLVVHSKQLKAEQERAARRARNSRVANHRALRAAPQSVVPFGQGEPIPAAPADGVGPEYAEENLNVDVPDQPYGVN